MSSAETFVDDRPAVPDEIEKAVDMLNNPWDYREELKHSLPDDRFGRMDPDGRIEAKAEWLMFKDRWVLYVEWDDTEPLTARHVVHKVTRRSGLGFQHYLASGSAPNKRYLDGETEYKFRRGADVAWLKVAHAPLSIPYVCEDCGRRSDDLGNIQLHFHVE